MGDSREALGRAAGRAEEVVEDIHSAVECLAEVGGISLLVVPAMGGKNDLGPAIYFFC